MCVCCVCVCVGMSTNVSTEPQTTFLCLSGRRFITLQFKWANQACVGSSTVKISICAESACNNVAKFSNLRQLYKA